MPGRLLPLRVYYFASFAALGAYAPYFPRWLEARGVQGISMGLIAGLLPAMGVLGPPAVGLAADALGLRGSILRIACAGACLSMAALTALSLGGAFSFAAVFAAVLAYAVFRSPMVMLADVVALERAPAAGTTYGEVRQWGSWGFLAALPLPPNPVAPRLPVAPEARALLAAPSFSLFLAVSFLAQIAHASYDLCFSLHLRDLGASDTLTGLAWAAGVLFEVALLRGADRIVSRAGAPRLLALALLGASIRWALLASVRSLPALLALQPLHAVSFALWWVASVAYIKDRAPAHALAAAQGLFSASVYRRAGGAAVFGLASAVALAAAILATFWRARVLKTIAAPRPAG